MFRCIEENEYGDNRCFICNKPFKHTRAWIKKSNNDLPELYMRVNHKYCEKLVKNIENTRNKLEELEFNLFCVRD